MTGLGLTTAALASALLAPGGHDRLTPRPAAPPVPPAVTVVATDYHLALPDTLPAGPTTFRLTNRGRELHQLFFVRLDAGKSVTDLVAAMKAAGEGPLPEWATGIGGPNGVDPGATSLWTTVRLLPGHYAALCIIPSPDGVPHVMKGMVSDLVVTPHAVSAAAFAHRPDVTVTLQDYGFQASRPITAGTHEVIVENGAAQWHEIELVRLLPGKTPADLLAWTKKMAGPPPARFLGGVAPLAPGQQNELSLALAPGHYVMLCFLPDAKDHKPHFAHGMVHDFVVE
ncbi:MAG TPA: hypothetical protein VNS52_03895 [Gemmatimonadaceae bacterium]|nr:hypothetical protein [Gemmatimonadaceae bacterium]